MVDLVQMFGGFVFYITWFAAILLTVLPLVLCMLLAVTCFLGRNEPREKRKEFYQKGVAIILIGCIGLEIGAIAYWIMPLMITSVWGQLGILLHNLVATRVALYLLKREQSILRDFQSS